VPRGTNLLGMTSSHRPPIRMEQTSEDQRVTTLELFFDLVFVFGITQVTSLMAHDLTVHGVLRGLLVIGVLWWCWIGYAWLCNLVRADEGAVRLALLVAMAAMFVLALSIPESFHDLPGGLPGPVVIAVCYFLFRALHLVLFWIISRDDPVLRRQLVRFMPSMLGGTALLLVASQFHGGTQTALWAAALAADYGGTLLGGASGWRLRSPGHFSERFGLIVIIALGESIVAIGVGVAELPISWPVVVAAVLGLTVSVGLWWIYFDVTAIHAEHAFATAEPLRQVRLARDAYTYLHFPMIAGIVLLAVGLKKILEYAGDTEHDHLTGVGLYCLYLGVAVYLLGHVVFKWVMVRVLSVARLVVAALAAAGAAATGTVPAIGQLGILAALVVALVGYEVYHYGAQREEVRHGSGEATF
jgi:low temperature requirement protein LtrA